MSIGSGIQTIFILFLFIEINRLVILSITLTLVFTTILAINNYTQTINNL